MSIDPKVAALPFHPIPDGESYCSVIPLNNAILNQPESNVLTPASSPTAAWKVPTFSFYITHHPSGKHLFFDLGIAHDWETVCEEKLKAFIRPNPPDVLGDVGAMLKEGGGNSQDVEAVIISHRHWDHTGNLAPFPNAEVVGGIDTFAGDLGRQTAGHKTLVIDWSQLPHSKIAAFDHAYDYLGDGSIWLCDSAGHTAGHLSALVRTTPAPEATYVLLGGDTVHHPFLVSPLAHNFRLATYPPRGGAENPRQHIALPPPCCMHSDMSLAWESINRTRRTEMEGNVMVVLGHDYLYWREWEQGEGEGRMWPSRKGIQGWKREGLKRERKYQPETYEVQ